MIKSEAGRLQISGDQDKAGRDGKLKNVNKVIAIALMKNMHYYLDLEISRVKNVT